MGRVYDIHDYQTLFKEIYGRAGKLMSPLTDVAVIFFLIISIAFSFSGCGSYINQLFGTPIIIGGIAAAIITLIIAQRGVAFFSKIQSVMCFGMLAILVTVYLMTILGFGWDSLVEKMSTRWVPVDFSTVSMLIWCVYFAATYVSFLSTYLISGKDIKLKSDVKKTICIGFVMNLSAIVLPVIALLAFAPKSFTFNIPMLYIMTDVLKFPPAQIVYTILLIFAFLTTGAACLVTLNNRLERYIPKKLTSKPVRALAVPVIVSIICVALSPLGLLSLLSTFSPYSSILSIITLLLPILIIAPRKIKAKNRALAAARDVPVVIRTADKYQFMIEQALDAGAQGVLVPTVETVGDCVAIVNAAKYAPVGTRGYCPRPATARWRENVSSDVKTYAADMNRDTYVMALIETPAGIKNLPELVKVNGIDAFMLGPADYGMRIGKDLWDPEVAAVLNEAAELIQKAGKICVSLSMPETFAAQYKKGAKVVIAGASVDEVLRNTYSDIKKGLLDVVAQNTR
ncbi:MAG: hypothetical protein LBN00_11480 [Oscillospiraceae bacterium]|jgi:2-keto-3-deoxy-L-rhamnonate aldolase RhmA/uncharacterized membrane protein YkvI|nr:hypothetical protein [Oscillospiraceae bacterium]